MNTAGRTSTRGSSLKQMRFVELRAQGRSSHSSADEMGVSKNTLVAWNAQMEGQIASLRAIEMEALQEQFFLGKEGRIRLLGGQLQALNDELSQRDLSEVPTLKLLEVLEKERVEARPFTDAEIRRLQELAD